MKPRVQKYAISLTQKYWKLKVRQDHGSRLSSTHQKCGRDLIERHIPHIVTQTGPRHLVADGEQNRVYRQDQESVCIIEQRQSSYSKANEPLCT